MGSPSARLKTRESLRPWVESGLEFVLRTEVECQDSGPVDQPVQQVPTVHTDVRSVSSAPPSHGEASVQSEPVQQSAPSHVAPSLPEPWSGFLRFAKSPAPKVIMTYMELGLDLGGQPDSRRSSALKNIQAHLKWPTGTMNFWPVAALSGGSLQPSTQMFWQGWEQWRAPNIVCFGEEALKVVLPDADPTLTTYMLEQVTVYKLEPLARLITMLPHEQQISVEELFKIRL
ncbi:hypothetical protein SYK_23140 [Pseudodesulfovibrio nedwellii]|uniref:Uncharacterized protein n=1 Tax=Pseudodesulfovibrio nedwellii TaxID=2973072 RepID=A0ABM8B2H7_9BACT|nr:hypothetical protein [Pseudodesulfovibrio nedwellii]BDQ37954.1 hypothetical protein SYK_23140 [Pseudodesulfovibrio nedwellii]